MEGGDAGVNRHDDLVQAIGGLAEQMGDLHRQAVAQYTPVVEDILRTGSRDVRAIEQTLDGLLGFCGSDPALQLYRRLCRHYFTIDPSAAVHYVHAYREMWDSEPDANTEAAS